MTFQEWFKDYADPNVGQVENLIKRHAAFAAWHAALAAQAQAAPTLEAILNCYSPDDTADDYQDKIRALFGVEPPYPVKGKSLIVKAHELMAGDIVTAVGGTPLNPVVAVKSNDNTHGPVFEGNLKGYALSDSFYVRRP